MLGISIYPFLEEEYDTLSYIDLAAKYGFGKVHIYLSGIESRRQENIIGGLMFTIQHARKHDMEVTLNLDFTNFNRFEINYDNLAFFKNMGVTGIRLESTSDGLVESLIMHDTSDLSLELNISDDTYYIENILSSPPHEKRIMGCHKFYSEEYSGLEYDYFMKSTKKYKDLGLRTSAFVNSQEAENSPYENADGLCTLEMHREMDIVTQTKHLFATGLIDEVIIANSFASKEELEAISDLNPNQIQFSVTLENKIAKTERRILLNHEHVSRGDMDCYSVRSSYRNLNDKNKDIPVNLTFHEVVLGDITIRNVLSGRNVGELSIEKFSRLNEDKTKNIIAVIVKRERFLIQYIKPWTKFVFKVSTEDFDAWEY